MHFDPCQQSLVNRHTVACPAPPRVKVRGHCTYDTAYASNMYSHSGLPHRNSAMFIFHNKSMSVHTDIPTCAFPVDFYSKILYQYYYIVNILLKQVYVFIKYIPLITCIHIKNFSLYHCHIQFQ